MSETEDRYTLKVSEAMSRDIGKAIARIGRDRIAGLGASIGDIVSITGRKTAVARVMPAREESGSACIQMDGILRENAGVGLDDSVEVARCAARDAAALTLCPTGKTRTPHSAEDIRHMSGLLEGIPAVRGNVIRIKLLGYSSQDYVVTDTSPEGVVRIGERCAIRLRSEGAVRKDNRVRYEDIGGLDRQIRKIREMIELPLKYPEVFERLGIEAPKGLLLYGPPGTGKTLIARAVANETDAYFCHVNGPEIIHKFYGESEARLREIFETAGKNAPSIIFLDEIDAISPKREDVNGDVEKRVVAQLLALMDGMKDRGQVIVVGATNIPNAIDPALRRPGRFDREIEIGIPDRNGRHRILQVHTRDMPLSGDVDLDKLAEITHGYVGADLQSLCRESAMSALRKVFPHIDFTTSSIPYALIESLRVTMEDFHGALRETEPSAIREVFIEVPGVSFDDIGGLHSVKRVIEKSIIWPQRYEELYGAYGCRAPRGILFHGAPGTGKTLLARAVASLGNANFIAVKGPQLLSKWVGESEKSLREIFRKAKQAAPCVIFFDEIDAMAPVRGRSFDSGATERLICQMLTEIDGIEELTGVMIIGATNRLDIVDPALLRPGRFDVLVEFGLPGLADRIEILEIHLRGKPAAADVDAAELGRLTEGYTGADIMDLCQRAALDALTEHLERMRGGETGIPREIPMRHFLNLIQGR